MAAKIDRVFSETSETGCESQKGPGSETRTVVQGTPLDKTFVICHIMVLCGHHQSFSPIGALEPVEPNPRIQWLFQRFLGLAREFGPWKKNVKIQTHSARPVWWRRVTREGLGANQTGFPQFHPPSRVWLGWFGLVQGWSSRVAPGVVQGLPWSGSGLHLVWFRVDPCVLQGCTLSTQG